MHQVYQMFYAFYMNVQWGYKVEIFSGSWFESSKPVWNRTFDFGIKIIL